MFISDTASYGKKYPRNKIWNEINLVHSYKKLKENWDSYGGLRIGNKVIKNAIYYLTMINDYLDLIEYDKLRIRTAPLSSGGIDIYIDYKNNALFINIEPNEIIALRIEDKNTVIEQLKEFKINEDDFERN